MSQPDACLLRTFCSLFPKHFVTLPTSPFSVDFWVFAGFFLSFLSNLSSFVCLSCPFFSAKALILPYDNAPFVMQYL